MHRIIPVQDGMRWNPIWLRQQMLRKMFKHSAKFFCERRMVEKQEGICRLTKANKKPSLHGFSADRTHILFPQLLQHCRIARQDTWPLLQAFVEKAQISFVFGSGKKWELCRQYLAKNSRKGLVGLQSTQKRPLSTEPLTIVSADRTTGLLHRILLPHKPRTEKKTHMFPQLLQHYRIARQDTLPLLQMFAVCGKTANEIGIRFGWLSRGKKWELCRDYLAKKSRKGSVCLQGKKQALCVHGTVDDFFRKPNEGPPPAEDLAAAQTTHGNNVHFSRNCYNIAALRDRIPGLCFRLLWKNANELSIRFGWLSHGKKWELCREYLAKEAGRNLSAYKANNKLSVHGSIDDCSADRVKNLLHRILLQQQECTQRMHIFPAPATTLPQ